MAKKRKYGAILSMRAGQDRTQVSEKSKDANKADLVLNIRPTAFANKGDLMRAIDVLRGRADNMDWPPVKHRKDKHGEPGGYGAEAADAAPETDEDEKTDPE